MKFRSAGAQLAAFSSLLILVVMLAFIGIAMYSAYSGVLATETHNMAQSTRQIETSLDDFISGHALTAKGLAQQKTVASTLALGSASLVVRDQISQTIKGNAAYAAVMAFNDKGIILAGLTSTGADLTGKTLPASDILPSIMGGKDFIGREAFRDKDTGRVVITVASPILTVTGVAAGGICIALDIETFSKRFIQPMRYGADGYPFVLDAKGIIVAHPDSSLLLSDVSQQAFVQRVLSNSEGVFDYDWKGRTKVLASVTSKVTGWKICASAYEDDIASIARKQRNILAVVGVIALGIMAAAIALMSRSMVTRPTALLCEYANAIAGGNLNARLEGTFRHELGTLADAMGRMVEDLKHRLGFAQGVLNGMVVPVLIVDREERTLFINQPCLDMLQLDGTPEQQHGRTLAEVFYNDPGRQTAVGRAMNERKAITNIDVTIKGHKGGEVQVLANVTYLADTDGNIFGGFCLYLDVTEARRQQAFIAEQNKRIGEAATQAETVSQNLSEAAATLEGQIDQAARGSDIQRQRTAEAATAMEQMNASVMEVARNAAGAAEQAETARHKAQEGASALDDSVRTIREAKQLADTLREHMGELGKQAEDIGRVLDVIADIADQTNLLALNAAIEAARAGEAGRGFAVVADEVRKLAEKTMNATREVDTAIKGIQTSARSNIDNTRKATDAIEVGTGMVGKSGEILREIVRLVETTADSVRNIATASEEQSAASEQITRSTDEINRIASETADAMQQSARAVQDVASLADELHGVIEEMRRQ